MDVTYIIKDTNNQSYAFSVTTFVYNINEKAKDVQMMQNKAQIGISPCPSSYNQKSFIYNLLNTNSATEVKLESLKWTINHKPAISYGYGGQLLINELVSGESASAN